jgi:hypothetical protein
MPTVGCMCSSETQHRLLPRSIADSKSLGHILIYTVHMLLHYILVIFINGAVWLMKQTQKFIERHRNDERTAAISVLGTNVTLLIHNNSVMEDSYTCLFAYLFIYRLRNGSPCSLQTVDKKCSLHTVDKK